MFIKGERVVKKKENEEIYNSKTKRNKQTPYPLFKFFFGSTESN